MPTSISTGSTGSTGSESPSCTCRCISDSRSVFRLEYELTAKLRCNDQEAFKRAGLTDKSIRSGEVFGYALKYLTPHLLSEGRFFMYCLLNSGEMAARLVYQDETGRPQVVDIHHKQSKVFLEAPRRQLAEGVEIILIHIDFPEPDEDTVEENFTRLGYLFDDQELEAMKKELNRLNVLLPQYN